MRLWPATGAFFIAAARRHRTCGHNGTNHHADALHHAAPTSRAGSEYPMTQLPKPSLDTEMLTDGQAMALALQQAHIAAEEGEVPVGAVVLHRGRVIATGHNRPVGSNDPTAHAEIVALRAAAAALGNYRLAECELFVTLEPCAMCSGAMLHARLNRVVFGAAEPKSGAAGSVLNLFEHASLNHHTQVTGGVLSDACGAVLGEFFRQRRSAQARAHEPLREDALRTPLQRFAALPGHPWANQVRNKLPNLDGLCLRYRDDVPALLPAEALTFLCIHSEQGWSYDFHDMASIWSAAGHRVVAVDLIGFGQSDKPKREDAHSVQWHQGVLAALVHDLDLMQVVLVGQGAGGLLAAALPKQEPSRYRGFVALDARMSSAIVQRSQHNPWPADWTPTPPGRAMQWLSEQTPARTDAAAQAPFPDTGHRAGPRAFARLQRNGFTALEWSTAQTPSGSASSTPARLAAQLMEVFPVGYSLP
jgi:tRNA(adenine34) deaminase